MRRHRRAVRADLRAVRLDVDDNLALRSVEADDDPPGPRLHGVHDIGALVDVLLADPDQPRTRSQGRPPDHPARGAVENALVQLGTR